MPMNLPRSILIFIVATGSMSFAQTPGPTPEAAVRVRVSLNSDGSHTVYQFDDAKRQAIATTTDTEGKSRGKVIYQLDESGRFASGVVFDPDGKLLFKAVYKYDGAGRLEQETHLGKDDAVIGKLVYKYNSAGKQLGYSVFDASGKLISGTPLPTPTATAGKRRNTLGR
jgi:hypothetical protein